MSNTLKSEEWFASRAGGTPSLKYYWIEYFYEVENKYEQEEGVTPTYEWVSGHLETVKFLQLI